MMKTIWIFEDKDLLRKGLEELLNLSDEYAVTGSYPDCLQITETMKSGLPDVVLMDIDMPGRNGIEAVKLIRSQSLKPAIIMLTVFDDNKHVFDAICAGASGYLLKKNISAKLIAAIEDVLEGGAPMSPSIAKMVVQSMQRTVNNPYQFNKSEQDLLLLLCQGNSYKMIAAATGFSFETVRSYIKKIYEKLQVHSATEAVSKAINERLI
ncbi:response regulator [Niabella aurantiaca]|uniref:response regulator n=1 Tax=Niabella aurantiaca TaxID=379900 RepID=UPI0003A56102|nr:response regulator transcription factor [Niabella aurantiaca]